MIDTASCYQNWETERVLGEILAELPESSRALVSIHSKANAGQLPHAALTKASILYQCEGSLARLGVDSLDVYYLHGPDPKTDVSEAIDAMAELMASGKVKEWGLSNYPAYKCVDIHRRCEARGVKPPTVNQCGYNVLSRDVERELVAACRELGVRCYHYNPLAGGLLTGKYSTIDDDKDTGRFGSKSPISGPVYSARYWKPEYFEAMDLIKKACAAHDVAPAEAALRWLAHHSILSPDHGDGVILGASSMKHLSANLEAFAIKDPLPESLVETMDAAWRVVKPVAPGYFRGYDPAPGSIAAFVATYQPGRVPASFP